MLSRERLNQLIAREPGDAPIFSLFLDVSVNSDNKRTHAVYLAQKRAEYAEAAGAKNEHRHEQVNRALDRVERWLAEEFDESNRGVCIFGELAGDWFEAIQFPVPIVNRFVVDEQPCLGPLLRILNHYHQHGIVLVDREHLRLLSVFMGRTLHEQEVETEPFPAPHDVQPGGYSAPGYQRRKEEETRHFFKEFAEQVAGFDRRYAPDDFVVLGTDENVKHFIEVLPVALREKIVHTAHAPVNGSRQAVLDSLHPFFEAREAARNSQAVLTLRDRVQQDHYATAGLARTLEQLQEGKVQMLVVGRDAEARGTRCATCGFYLAGERSTCPYCGGEVRDGIDLIETMIRLATEQEANIEFVEPAAVRDMEGVGALLRF
ncbi:MAG: hypothetical protein ACRELV_10595 [Longimicrobiales bacterium]